jgi:DMSO/TMAO reductase YedYZ heme-binding membrane subunit
MSNAAYLLGILMVVLFLVLWITSFDSIHKRLGARKWKKIQNGSYVLYAMLFLHSILIHTGWMLSMGGGRARGKDVILSSVIGITSTCLVFGSYLILRLRKRKTDALRKKGND